MAAAARWCALLDYDEKSHLQKVPRSTTTTQIQLTPRCGLTRPLRAGSSVVGIFTRHNLRKQHRGPIMRDTGITDEKIYEQRSDKQTQEKRDESFPHTKTATLTDHPVKSQNVEGHVRKTRWAHSSSSSNSVSKQSVAGAWQERSSKKRCRLPISSVSARVRQHVFLSPADFSGVLVDLRTVGDAMTQSTAEGTAFHPVHLLNRHAKRPKRNGANGERWGSKDRTTRLTTRSADWQGHPIGRHHTLFVSII